MYVRTHEGLGHLLSDGYLGPPFDSVKAVKANRQFRNTLGWKNHLDRLEKFVFLYSLEKHRVHDEEALAIAVAHWQDQQPGLPVDGTIGPKTWSLMRAAGVLKSSTWQNRSCRTTPVTYGEFGTALKHFANTHCVPDEVAQLLKGSPRFQRIAETLDSKYIALVGPDIELVEIPEDWDNKWGVTNDGILSKGTYRGLNVKGRRVLWIRLSSDGSQFSPAGSIEGSLISDTIWLQKPSVVRQKADPREMGGWIENISHESIHAYHRVTRTGTPAAKLVDRIRARIQEEILTRKQEAEIVLEAKGTSLGKKLLATFIPAPGATDPASVERGFFPSKVRRTYLEHFVLMELLEEASSRERLAPEDVNRKNEDADRIPLKGWRDHKFSSNYSKFRFWLRVIDFRWQQAIKLRTPDTPEFERLKEQVLQEHANVLFGGVIAYTAQP